MADTLLISGLDIPTKDHYSEVGWPTWIAVDAEIETVFERTESDQLPQQAISPHEVCVEL